MTPAELAKLEAIRRTIEQLPQRDRAAILDCLTTTVDAYLFAILLGAMPERAQRATM